MSERWNLEPSDDGLVLMNSSCTSVTMTKRSKFDPLVLMSRMEELGVPLGYTKGLKEIRFTIHRDSGTYMDGVIKLDSLRTWGPGCVDSVCQTFVHELGHHVDETEAISCDHELVKEKVKKSCKMPDSYAQKSASEYVAVGFEVFYFGDRKERSMMKKSNPKLYSIISRLHRKYRCS